MNEYRKQDNFSERSVGGVNKPEHCNRGNALLESLNCVSTELRSN